MTREEAIKYLNTLYMALAVFPNQQISLGNIGKMKESVSMALEALEQEPCEDAISRRDALDCFTATGLKKFDFILDARDKIKNLPPVTPQLKEMGQTMWIPVSEKMPQEREWIGTKQFGTTRSDEVYVTFETPKGDRFTKHLSFQNGKLSLADQQTINAFYKGSVPVAWMPLPAPYVPEINTGKMVECEDDKE